MSLDPDVYRREEERRFKRLAECPEPLMIVPGPFLVVWRDAADERYGKIVIPEIAQKATSTGTIVMIGDGFTLDQPYNPQEFHDGLPFQEGDRVVFSKYGGDEIGCRVMREWWDREENQKELASMRDMKRENLLRFVLLKPSQIYAVLDYPEKEVWEE
jgi:co-chaperonin GroES (HSP10)